MTGRLGLPLKIDLSGKTAVVTGASRGIGHAICETFAHAGAIVLGGSRSVPDPAPSQWEHLRGDLGIEGGPEALVGKALARHGGVDILVNNVGAAPKRWDGFLSVSDEEWRSTIELNLLSAIRACRTALPTMLERSSGVIINIASLNAKLPQPLIPDYSASKAAMLALTKTLAEEYGPNGIRVLAVSPGAIRTSAWDDPELRRNIDLETVPRDWGVALGRLGDPDELARVVAMLACDYASFMTGVDVIVDGGMHVAI